MYTMYGTGFIDMVRSFIPSAKVVGGAKEIVVRCKECGDSNDVKHAHMYLKVPLSPTDVSLYHCKKCNASGVVNEEFLRKYGCNDPQILIEYSQNLQAIYNSPNRLIHFQHHSIYSINNRFISNRIDTMNKLGYINSRIGSNFTLQDLLRLKIFLNLSDVINDNKLQCTRSPNIIDALDKHYIGFITYNNSRAIMRKITDDYVKDLNYRYINYNLISDIDDGVNYYVIPSQASLDSCVNIHIAEGVFDILSIFYNLNKCNTINNIYVASGGKSYLQALRQILEYSGLIFYNIHIYPDKDVYPQELNRIFLKHVRKLPCRVHVHRNTFNDEKDFGVPINRIRDYVEVYNET